MKAREERKIRVLEEAGFDMSLDGKDMASVQYQNANNSVRVTDEFMQAVVDDADWHLRAVTDGAVVQHGARPATSCARSRRPRGSAPTPACSSTPRSTAGTPRANTGRINGSNPCSEYMHLDNSACNLASLNLLKFLDLSEDATRRHLRRRGLQPRRRDHVHRPGDPRGPGRLPDRARSARRRGASASSASATPTSAPCSWPSACPTTATSGRAYAAAITSLMTGHAYATSARTAARMGAVRRLRGEPGAHAPRAAPAPGGRRPHRRGARPVRPARRRPDLLGRGLRARPTRSACATRRRRCSPPPAPSA